jgi:hypothetical protein
MVISEKDALGPQRAIQARLEKFKVDHMAYTFLVLNKPEVVPRVVEEFLTDVIANDTKCIVYESFNDNPVAMIVSYKRYAELLSIENAYAELRQAHP